jgi:sensor domain CHASE-containing protein
MAAIDQIAAARDEEFAGRVAMIIFRVAQAVATEAPTEPDHDIRLAYAGRNIRGEENPKLVGAHVISSNPTIAAAIDANPELKGSNVPDADIEFALSSIWTARAKAFA